MSEKKRIKCKSPQIDCDAQVDDEFCMYAYGVCSQQVAEATRPQDSSGSAEFALLGARKLKAFDWLDANADELSMEWTGTHNHIYSGNEENLERLGCGRSLLEAIENCMGI